MGGKISISLIVGVVVAAVIWGVIYEQTNGKYAALNWTLGDYNYRRSQQSLQDNAPIYALLGGVIAGGILLALMSSGRSSSRPNVIAKSATTASHEMKCPFCAEMIKRDAKICRYCGKDLPSSKSTAPPIEVDPYSEGAEITSQRIKFKDTSYPLDDITSAMVEQIGSMFFVKIVTKDGRERNIGRSSNKQSAIKIADTIQRARTEVIGQANQPENTNAGGLEIPGLQPQIKHGGSSMTKKEWTIIGVLGMAVVVVLVCLGGLMLAMLPNTNLPQVSVPSIPVAIPTAQQICDDPNYFKQTSAILDRWIDAATRAGSTSRIALTSVIGDMQQIRRDYTNLPHPSCANRFHQLVTDSMNDEIDGYLFFMQQSSDAIVSVYLKRANDEMYDALAEMKRIRGMGVSPTRTPPPVPTFFPTPTRAVLSVFTPTRLPLR